MFEAERELRAGHGAWLRGDLDEAARRLEAAHRLGPASPDPLYTLARALSEMGRPGEALSALEEAGRLGGPDEGGRVLRAMVLLDHGKEGEGRAELSRVPPGNVLGRGLLAILDYREGRRREAVALPRAARWMADVAGRLLAAIEEDLRRASPEAAVEVHHALLAPETPGDCRNDLDQAFRAGRHGEVESLHRKGVDPDPWTDLFAAFSLLTLGKEARAIAILGPFERTHRSREDLHALTHLVRGLCHTWSGRPAEAGWAFSRAARASDIWLDSVLTAVAAKAGVKLELVGEVA